MHCGASIDLDAHFNANTASGSLDGWLDANVNATAIEQTGPLTFLQRFEAQRYAAHHVNGRNLLN